MSTLNAAFQCSDSQYSEQHDAAKSIDVMPPQIAEMNEFYARLHVANPKAAILSIIPGYSETFNSSSSLPPIMLDFAKPEYMDIEYADLLNECEKIFCSLFVTSEQAARLERVTREQAKSRLWYSHRAGRITASKIRLAAHSPPGSPSMSLINAICYPQNVKFISCATRYVDI